MFSWLSHFADWLVYDVFALSAESHLGAALNFFVYDVIKILLLLFVIVSVMGVVNVYFPVDRLRAYLQRKKLYGLEYLLASLFGAITPFCSCSSVPLFIGFVRGGIPLGVTFSFLITSPLVNEIALAMFIGYFGLKTTLIYAAFGIMLGALGGFILGKMRLERYLSPWVQDLIAAPPAGGGEELGRIGFLQHLPEILRDAWSMVRGIVVYVIIGIGIGAAMHGYVPANFFEDRLGGGEWWTVPLAVIVAVPIYANAAGVVPVIQVLVSKGVPLGTSIAFMMSTIGLSIPEATLLKKVMTLKLIAIFFSVVTLFIILSGILFNIIL